MATLCRKPEKFSKKDFCLKRIMKEDMTKQEESYIGNYANGYVLAM